MLALAGFLWAAVAIVVAMAILFKPREGSGLGWGLNPSHSPWAHSQSTLLDKRRETATSLYWLFRCDHPVLSGVLFIAGLIGIPWLLILGINHL